MILKGARLHIVIKKKSPKASDPKHGFSVGLQDQFGTYLSDSFQNLFHLLKTDPIIWKGRDGNYARSVIAIAPVDRQYQPAGTGTTLEDISYFVVQGSNDMDMRTYDGSRQFKRQRFQGEGHYIRAGLYVFVTKVFLSAWNFQKAKYWAGYISYSGNTV